MLIPDLTFTSDEIALYHPREFGVYLCVVLVVATALAALNCCGQGKGILLLASQVGEPFEGLCEMGNEWYPKRKVGCYCQTVGDEMQAVNSHQFKFTDIFEQWKPHRNGCRFPRDLWHE